MFLSKVSRGIFVDSGLFKIGLMLVFLDWPQCFHVYISTYIKYVYYSVLKYDRRNEPL